MRVGRTTPSGSFRYTVTGSRKASHCMARPKINLGQFSFCRAVPTGDSLFAPGIALPLLAFDLDERLHSCPDRLWSSRSPDRLAPDAPEGAAPIATNRVRGAWSSDLRPSRSGLRAPPAGKSSAHRASDRARRDHRADGGGVEA